MPLVELIVVLAPELSELAGWVNMCWLDGPFPIPNEPFPPLGPDLPPPNEPPPARTAWGTTRIAAEIVKNAISFLIEIVMIHTHFLIF